MGAGMPGSSASSGLQNESNAAYGGTDELFAVERGLPRYTADIVGKMVSRLGRADRVLEFGAGIGTLAMEWVRQTGRTPECVELDPDQRKLIRERGLACYGSIGELSSTYDGIYTSNVLEHVFDDVGALKELRSALCKDGVIAIFVPAFMCLYSDADRAVGHYRRYRRRELRDKVEAAGYSITDCCYVDSLGFFAWLSTRICGYRTSTGLGNERSLVLYDTWLYPLSRLLDRLGLRHLFGKNLLLVARRRES
jgi:SAM-dependent methyltransferase